MTSNSRKLRSALLTGASTALIAGMGASAALAAPSEDQTSTNSITVQQQFNDFNTPTPGQTLDGNTEGTIRAIVNSDDPTEYALQNSTVTVGSSTTTGNSTSATGYANTADLTVNADLNNVTGSGLSNETASTTSGANVTAVTDIGIALSQQNVSTIATVSDDTDLGITLDYGATDSTARIAGNKHNATGVLNSGVTLVDATANNSSGSSGIGSAQSSIDSTLAASVSSLDRFETGSGNSDIALTNSTAELTGNSQAATAVANSGSNSQSITGNDVAFAAEADGQAQAATGGNATALGGYATASKQELSGAVAASVSATIDDGVNSGGFSAVVTGNIVGSTLANDANSARTLARGNEVSNATAIDANSIASAGSGTAAAIASGQDISGTVAINALVTSAGVDGPLVSNNVAGDVADSSAITASGNSILADAAGNRGGNSITASGTTINSVGLEGGSAANTTGATTANAAFAIANNQSVSTGTTITASLVDDTVAPTGGTSVATAITGSVTDSSVASNGNTLTARANGNATLTGGNAVALTGTNVATTAAIASVQSMDGSLVTAIGAEGTDPVPPTTITFTGSGGGSPGDYTFSGTAVGTELQQIALQAAYGGPNLTFTWNAGESLIEVSATGGSVPYAGSVPFSLGGSAGTLASGGVVVTVGNDITNSSVTVDGNATAGSAIGNSATNRVAADATNLESGSVVTAASASTTATGISATADLAVANTQSVGVSADLASTVGAVFGISAEGASDPLLSDVDESTVSIADNTLESSVTGNSASNAAQLSATNLSNTSAVANSQQMNGQLAANVADFSGAFAVIGRDVTSSSILVEGNEISGSAIGNEAANTLAVDGNATLTSGDTAIGASADPSNGTPDPVAIAQADHALANVQSLGAAASLSTDVVAGYGITTLGVGAPGADDDTSDIAASTLSVSDNIQSATTRGNTATNAVSISGGAISTNVALLSVQTSAAGTVSASSDMTVGAPAANTGSTLALNGNANSAAATVNTATNTLTVNAATSLASTTVVTGPPATEGANAVLSGTVAGDYAASADFVVNNAQAVTVGAVTADANTNVWNNDGTLGPDAFETDGIQQSIVDVRGNSTLASATSNQATNSLALSANSTSASAGVLNQQGNGAGVTATASTTAGVAVAGYDATGTDPSPVNASAVNVAGNSTVARAGGNSATNSLSASATTFANNSAGGQTLLNADRTDSVNASYAVLNEQANSGPIAANATVTYGATFDTLGTAPSAINTSVGVNGNSATSVAFGNAATNQVTLTALNSPAAGIVPTTAGLASNQVNTGNVSATTQAPNVAIAAYGGAVTQSGLSIGGNALSAAAYGNSATNTLTIGGNNVNVTVNHLIP